jgi:hypothetical protein
MIVIVREFSRARCFAATAVAAAVHDHDQALDRRQAVLPRIIGKVRVDLRGEDIRGGGLDVKRSAFAVDAERLRRRDAALAEIAECAFDGGDAVVDGEQCGHVGRGQNPRHRNSASSWKR